MSVVPVTSEGCVDDSGGQQPETMLESGGHTATKAIMVWVACAANGAMMTLACVAAVGRNWVLGPAAAGFFDDICVLC